MSQVVSYGRSIIPAKCSPKKEFRGHWPACGALCRFWCSALVLSSVARGGVGGPRLREQSSVFPSAATVGGWGPPQMVPGQVSSTGKRGAGTRSGDGCEVARSSLGWASRHRPERTEHRAEEVSSITLFAASCRWSRSGSEVHCFRIFCKCREVSFYWSL